MPIRRFKTSLLSQAKDYGVMSGKTNLIPIASGGTITEAGGFRIHSFTYTGSDQTLFIYSSGIIEVFLWGAAGGGANAEGLSDPGGPGGYATGKINVFSSTNFVIQVGQGGGQSTSSARPSRPYPNAGLPSIRSSYISGAGGGRSAIFSQSVTANNAIIIAGGGGGGAGMGAGGTYPTNGVHGGAGGGTNGSGGGVYFGGSANNGGTQFSGGSTGSGSGRVSGQLAGADAGNGTAFSAGWNAAGGGGDGWFGGGAQEAHVGGGGGSGYLSSNIFDGSLEMTSLVYTRYGNAINPPQTGNTYYQTGVGRGNINATGGNGLVVIRYSLSPQFAYE